MSGRHSQVQEELDFLAGAVPTAAEAAHGGGGERGTGKATPPRPNGSEPRCRNGGGSLREEGMTGDVVLLPASPGIASGVVAGKIVGAPHEAA